MNCVIHLAIQIVVKVNPAYKYYFLTENTPSLSETLNTQVLEQEIEDLSNLIMIDSLVGFDGFDLCGVAHQRFSST